MAENLIDYMKKLEENEPPAFSPPEVYYGTEEDSLTIYFNGAESYAHRLNSLVTVFLSFEGNRPVGCQVKGFRRKLLSDGSFALGIQRKGKLELGLFFHLLAYEVAEVEPRNRLVELGQQAKGIEFDTEKLVPC
jgi:hypothetical protein